MIVGMHFSMASGYHKAVEKAHELGCNALQIFSQNPTGWKGRVPPDSEVAEFRRLVQEYRIEAVVVHTPYLVNLASLDRVLANKSHNAVTASVERADQLGAQYVVTHIGSARGRTRASAIRSVARRLDQVLKHGFHSQLLLELMAGAGQILGATFVELQDMIKRTSLGSNLGICLDTAHAYASGYDVASEDGLRSTLDELEETVGLERLKVIHVNDTRVKLGSHRDRHHHVGRGNIGLDGFRRIVNHSHLRHLPFILETPIDDDCDDKCNLETFKALFE